MDFHTRGGGKIYGFLFGNKSASWLKKLAMTSQWLEEGGRKALCLPIDSECTDPGWFSRARMVLRISWQKAAKLLPVRSQGKESQERDSGKRACRFFAFLFCSWKMFAPKRRAQKKQISLTNTSLLLLPCHWFISSTSAANGCNL